MSKIEAAYKEVEKAQKALADALEKEFPPGSRVNFFLAHAQSTPSSGVVLGCSVNPGGYIRVENANWRRRVKRVFYKDIISCERVA